MTLRWGICGAGKICSDFTSALMTLPEGEHEVVAVAARSLDSAKTFADKFKIKTAYGSYDSLATDPNIDIVYIGVIHTGHVPLTKQMINADKHVLCEKPMALSLEEVRQVTQLAKEKKKFFMEAVWSRAFPVYDKIKKEINSGCLGDIQMVTAKMCLPVISVERIKTLSMGGGCLYDIGLYPLQFANWVFNNEKPEKITAVATLTSGGVDEDGCVILNYKNGAKAVLIYSGKTHTAQNYASINGSKASIEIPDRFWCPSEAIFPSGKFTNEVPEGPVPYFYHNSGGLRYQADLARKCIQAGEIESPVMSFADSEKLYCLVEEVKKQIGLKWEDE